MSRTWLNTPWDPTVAIDCSYSRAHAAHHVPHPDTGKLICMACHPTLVPPKETSDEATGQQHRNQ